MGMLNDGIAAFQIAEWQEKAGIKLPSDAAAGLLRQISEACYELIKAIEHEPDKTVVVVMRLDHYEGNLSRLSEYAFDAIKKIERELSGIRGGGGEWHPMASVDPRVGVGGTVRDAIDPCIWPDLPLTSKVLKLCKHLERVWEQERELEDMDRKHQEAIEQAKQKYLKENERAI
jgi:hypothetical protein